MPIRVRVSAHVPVEPAQTGVAMGDERAHPEFHGNRECAAIVLLRVCRHATSRGDIAKQAQRARLTATLSPFTGQRECPTGGCKCVVGPPGKRIRFAQRHQQERQCEAVPHGIEGAQRLLHQLQAFVGPSEQGKSMAQEAQVSSDIQRLTPLTPDHQSAFEQGDGQLEFASADVATRETRSPIRVNLFNPTESCMSNKNLSTVANDVIATYGITATNVINTYRFGGERIAGFVDRRFAAAVNRGAAALRKDLRSNLIGSQQRVSGYYVKGVNFGTDQAQNVVGVAVDLATKGVSLVATNADRIDRAAKLNALAKLNRVVMPAADLVIKVAERLEEGSSERVKPVSGKALPAKALATRKLKASARKATATCKQVTKATTRKAGTMVADAATETSNAARRVARKTRTTGKSVAAAVANTATETSNAARRVARKAKATAKAA